MKAKRISFFKKILVSLFLVSFPMLIVGWGFWGHQRINRMAVFCLPDAMFGFYKYHIDYLTVHAVDPDKRRYAVEGEAACHYIDIDRYGEHPFDSIPVKWKDAVAKYGEDTLMAHGIVPWHIEKMMYRLTHAFEEKDFEKILKYSGDIGHYIGDAHVPLHCTRNYNGQLTNQNGIHGFWESRVPELIGDDYDFLVGKCKYIDYPLKEAWRIVKESYGAHDSVLLLEKKLNLEFPVDRKYAFEKKGNMTIKTYSKEYTLAYNQLLNDMAERRMRAAIVMVASFWYTAWVNGGQPDLTIFKGKDLTQNTLDQMKKEEAEWEKGKIKPKGHDE